jgi:hypothetical protein
MSNLLGVVGVYMLLDILGMVVTWVLVFSILYCIKIESKRENVQKLASPTPPALSGRE